MEMQPRFFLWVFMTRPDSITPPAPKVIGLGSGLEF